MRSLHIYTGRHEYLCTDLQGMLGCQQHKQNITLVLLCAAQYLRNGESRCSYSLPANSHSQMGGKDSSLLMQNMRSISEVDDMLVRILLQQLS